MATLNFTDIQTRVMNRLRIPTTNTDQATRVAAIINDTYRDIYMKYNWWWCVKRSTLTTSDDINTGTVSVTNASTDITFSSAPTPSTVGRILLVTGNADSNAAYRISAHTAGATAATLDSVYTGDTNATASYNVYQDSYSLPTDLGTLIHVKRFGYSWPLDDIGYERMLDLKNYDTRVNKPQAYAVYDFATTGDPTTARRIIFHPYPDKDYHLEIHYKQVLNTELSGTTRPLIPDDYVQVLIYGSLANGFPLMLNDVERGNYYGAKFADMLNLMVAVQREQEGRPTIQPEDSYRRFYTKDARRNLSQVDLGSSFDRFPAEW